MQAGGKPAGEENEREQKRKHEGLEHPENNVLVVHANTSRPTRLASPAQEEPHCKADDEDAERNAQALNEGLGGRG